MSRMPKYFCFEPKFNYGSETFVEVSLDPIDWQELVKRETAAKVLLPDRKSRDGMGYTYYDFCCPKCGRLMAYEPEWQQHTKEKFCWRCGQPIRWPDPEAAP